MAIFGDHKVITKQFEKPCYELGWCPYYSLVEDFKSYTIDNNKFTYKLFSHFCPVFYHAEFISELK